VDAVWQWGLGVFLIIVCGVGAMFSPIGKQSFHHRRRRRYDRALHLRARPDRGAQHQRRKIKVHLLKAHRKLNRRTCPQGGLSVPSGRSIAPVPYSSDVKPPCGPMEGLPMTLNIQEGHQAPWCPAQILGVPQGQKIPEAKIKAAAHSSDPTPGKRAKFAETLKGLNHS